MINNDYDLITPNITPRPYYANEVVRIINMKQAKAYINNGVYPIDLYTSRDKTGKKILVMIFLREQTKEVYDLWCKYALEEDTI